MVLEAIQPNSRVMEIYGVADYISSTDAAKILNVSARAVTEWCKTGEIEGAEKLNDRPNSPWIISKEGFAKFKAKRAAKAEGKRGD